MPTKTTKAKKRYEIDGKKFTWHPEEDDEAGPLPDLVIPLRIKMKVIRSIGDGDIGTDDMFAILEQIMPGQTEVLDEMDANDFAAMFTTWQEEYQKLSGATLGE